MANIPGEPAPSIAMLLFEAQAARADLLCRLIHPLPTRRLA